MAYRIILFIGLVAIVAAAASVLTFRPAREHNPNARQIPESASYGVPELEGDLVIFHAGSLSVPFAEISKRFMEKNPKVKVLAEAAGSRDTARKVSDLGRMCDVLGSADAETIYELLMPGHASWCIGFARNELVVAYTGKSKSAGEITKDNWKEILLKPGIRFGRADPGRDPCGYRTLMVFRLAELHYGIPGLATKLEEKDGKRFIRPKETDLLALLESGEIDYLFIYLSVAVQHNLKYAVLPSEINLGEPSLAGDYSKVSVSVKGANPGETSQLVAAPIVYGVTIPSGAENRPAAEAWVELLISPEGAEILEKCGQPPITPAVCPELEIIPQPLREFCVKAGAKK